MVATAARDSGSAAPTIAMATDSHVSPTSAAVYCHGQIRRKALA